VQPTPQKALAQEYLAELGRKVPTSRYRSSRTLASFAFPLPLLCSLCLFNQRRSSPAHAVPGFYVAIRTCLDIPQTPSKSPSAASSLLTSSGYTLPNGCNFVKRRTLPRAYVAHHDQQDTTELNLLWPGRWPLHLRELRLHVKEVVDIRTTASTVWCSETSLTSVNTRGTWQTVQKNVTPNEDREGGGKLSVCRQSHPAKRMVQATGRAICRWESRSHRGLVYERLLIRGAKVSKLPLYTI